jgi:hypothetical protein
VARPDDDGRGTPDRRPALPRDPESLLDARRDEAITELGRATRRYRHRLRGATTGRLIDRHPLATLAVCATGGFLLARASGRHDPPSGDGDPATADANGDRDTPREASPALAGTLAATAITVGRRYLFRKLREVLSESGA